MADTVWNLDLATSLPAERAGFRTVRLWTSVGWASRRQIASARHEQQETTARPEKLFVPVGVQEALATEMMAGLSGVEGRGQ
jgi:hypothetical protein